ncbi:MAG: hypothetical protein ACLFVJ_13395 [Persicimonas sp.]
MSPLYKMIICAAAVVIVGGGAASYAAVEAGMLHEQVLDELERKLDEQFVGDFDARRLTGTLVWGFTAHDVEIRDGSGEPVAHIDELQVDASAFELLDGNLRFDRARLMRPTVFVDRVADGEKNVDEVFRSRNPSGKSRPPGQVLFEMTRAQVVDGQLVYLDADRAHGFIARAIQADAHFQVLSGKRIRTRFERLDAQVLADASAQPRDVRMTQARIDLDRTSCTLGADELTVDANWLVEGARYSRPRGISAAHPGPTRPIEVRGRAISPDGGWLQLDGHVARRDDSYALEIEADDFRPADWPGAPGWSWLVLDGAGTVSGRGRTPEDVDAAIRWTTGDVDVAGERLEEIRLTARLGGGRVDVEALDIMAADFSATASGRVSEGGTFGLEMDTRAEGSFASRLADRLGVELKELSHLDLSTKASGALDLSELEDGVTQLGATQLLEHINADTTWKAEDVSLDDLRWKVAGGSLVTRLPHAGQVRSGALETRSFSYEGSAAFQKLRHREFAADVLRTTIEGDGVLDAGSGLEGLSYDLQVDGDRLSLGEHRATGARMATRGALSPAGADAEWPLEALSADGTLDLIEYSHPELSARRVATNIDVRGSFPLGEGSIMAHMSGLRVNDRRFRAAKMQLDLLEGQNFRLKSKARVEVSLIPDLPMYLDLFGRHGRDLKAFSVERFSVGRPGMRWKIRQPGLVKFEDGAVALQSLTLQRRSQKVRLDGSFGDAQSDSVSAIVSRLKNAQVRSFLDFLPFLKSRPPLTEQAP